MAFTNVNLKYINGEPYEPSQLIDSKGDLNSINVADGMGEWLDSGTSLVANGLVGVNKITSNATNFTVLTNGGPLLIGTPTDVNYDLSVDAPTAISQALLTTSAGVGAGTAWTNCGTVINLPTYLYNSRTGTPAFGSTITMKLVQVGQLVTLYYPPFEMDPSQQFVQNAEYLLTLPNLIPVGLRPIYNFTSGQLVLYAINAPDPAAQYNSNSFIIYANSDGSIWLTGTTAGQGYGLNMDGTYCNGIPGSISWSIS
jgi:hypothetical protein